jgi:hypothetical protein
VLPFTIDDPIEDPLNNCVEVTVDFGTERRWLFFVIPTRLASAGDFIEGTKVRIHLGERHMVVVSELNEAVIETVLHQLYADGKLADRTLPPG